MPVPSCVAYMCACITVYVKYFAHIPNLVDIFDSCTYLAITGETDCAVDGVLAYIYKNVGSTSPFGMLAM